MGAGGDQAAQGSSTHLTHGWVGVDVVPEHAHRLFESPCLAAFPFQVVAAEVFAKHPPRFDLKKMPGANQV